MAVGGSGVFDASRNLVYGSARAAHYVLTGSREGTGCAAIVLVSPDSNRHNVFYLKAPVVRIGWSSARPDVGAQTDSKQVSERIFDGIAYDACCRWTLTEPKIPDWADL